MRSWLAGTVLVIGLGLALAPVAFDMFDRAPKGATMLSEFRPFMTERRLDTFLGDMKTIDRAVIESNGPIRARLAASASSSTATYAGFDQFAKSWPTIDRDMTDLLGRVRRNVGTYRGLAALPSFSLFPWFFLVPGVLLILVGGYSFVTTRTGALRVVALVIGIGFVVAPMATSMFGRASAGADMMSDFSTIMTRDRVHVIQGYFGTMAVGQGSIRLQIVPALHNAGVTDRQIATTYPAVTRLDRDWVGIIGDMTPMIGAMSDNVVNYEALAALPPFALFPWFFAAPGVVLIALVVIAEVSGRRAATTSSAPSSSTLIKEAI